MNGIFLFAVGILLGAVAGLVICTAINRRAVKTLRARIRALKAGEEDPKKPETMKRVVWACVTNGFAWVWCSYILAALGREQIADGLSKLALAEIIIPVFIYAAKSLFENFSKHNHWPDPPITEPPDTEPEQAGDGEAMG